MKTFADLGLTFDFDTECITCYDGSCHSNVISKEDGKEYNVRISTTKLLDKFHISIYGLDTSTDMDGEDAEYDDENEAVCYLCDRFINFKCF